MIMKAVIFDMDGTLIDSMKMWRDLDRDFFGKRNIEFTQEMGERVKTMSLKMCSRFFKDFYKLEETAEEIYNEFCDRINEFYLYEAEEKENAFTTLKKYKEKGYKTVLGTATGKEFVEKVLERFEIEKYFDFVVTSDMVDTSKSSSEFFRKISEMLDVSPEEIFLFDDAPNALNAARNIGIVTVGVYDESAENHWESIVRENRYSIRSFKEWEVR